MSIGPERGCRPGRRGEGRRALGFALAAAIAAGPAGAAAPYVWWEGENASATNFPADTAFGVSTFEFKRHLLSGGNWLTNAGVREGDEAYAKYRVAVPEGGEYELWCRKFWKHGPFRWRFDVSEWAVCPFDVALADETPIRVHLGANWVHLGRVKLKGGAHDFEVRLLAGLGENLTAAFDCFVLIKGMFEPRGRLKPEDTEKDANDGFFPWAPAVDEFGSEALLDLRSLNEKRAGESGFVRRKGGGFVLGNGEEVRFWAVNAGAGIAGLDHASVDYLARRLAKVGVNMVRYHSPVFGEDPEAADPRKLDDLFYFVSALKREGIYTTLSFYFPLWFQIKPEYGIPGYDETENKTPFHLLFVDPRMRDLHRAWARAMLTTKNPYTGAPLAADPAVAIVEIVNEDSFFFWTFSRKNMPEAHLARLEKSYGDWLKRKYESFPKLRRAWLEAREEGDDAKTGRFVLYDAWHMTRAGLKDAGPGRRKRVGDQVEFLAGKQRGFYASTVGYFREKLGVKALISPGNWTVADPELLDPLERYTYTAGDVIDRHGYFEGGGHKGDGAGYSVRPGHEFENLAAVRAPEQLPLKYVQVAGYPAIMSEIGWTNPNLYRSDYAFLAAAYGALQGLDGIYTFAVGGAFWDRTMGKFALNCPVIMGSFPACALLYRRGDVKRPGSSIRRVLRLEDLYALKGAGGAAAPALDTLRAADVPEGAAGGESIDPLAFYTGPVEWEFSSAKNGERSRAADLSKLINREWKTVRSSTGELAWDYGKGIVRLDTKLTQGAAGFLSQVGPIELSTATIETDNDFMTVIVTSLDGKPLEVSRRILIQAMTIERPFGFRASGGDDGKIEELGGPPFGVKKIHVRVKLKLASGDSPVVRALDPHGYPSPAQVLATEAKDGSLTVKLDENSVYHVIRR